MFGLLPSAGVGTEKMDRPPPPLFFSPIDLALWYIYSFFLFFLEGYMLYQLGSFDASSIGNNVSIVLSMVSP